MDALRREVAGLFAPTQHSDPLRYAFLARAEDGQAMRKRDGLCVTCAGCARQPQLLTTPVITVRVCPQFKQATDDVIAERRFQEYQAWSLRDPIDPVAP